MGFWKFSRNHLAGLQSREVDSYLLCAILGSCEKPPGGVLPGNASNMAQLFDVLGLLGVSD